MSMRHRKNERGFESMANTNQAGSWPRAVLSCICFYVSMMVMSIWAHDLLLDPPKSTRGDKQVPCASIFLVSYALLILAWRLHLFRRPHILHEYCWLCNLTLYLCAYGIATNRPALGAACCVTVGIDQLLWYVDIATFVATGRFQVGVARYLMEQSWASRVTATHHLWTLPLILGHTRGVAGDVRIYVLSSLLVALATAKCRVLTPECEGSKELNVNLAFAPYKDLPYMFGVFEIRHPSAIVYLLRLWSRWLVLNALVFAFLVGLSSLVFAEL